MPKITLSDIVNNTDVSRNAQAASTLPDREPVKKDREYSTWETLKAAFKSENVVGSYISQTQEQRDLTSPGRKLNPDFNPFEYLSKRGRLQDAVSVSFANSEDEVDSVLDWVDEQNKNRQIVHDSGWIGTLSAVGAGVLDPTILLPATGVIKAGALANRAMQGIKSGAALTGGVVGLQEALLHDSQTQRTTQESALAVLSGTVFGGIVGGIVGAVAPRAGLKPIASRQMPSGEKNAHSGLVHEAMHNKPRTSYNPSNESLVVSTVAGAVVGGVAVGASAAEAAGEEGAIGGGLLSAVGAVAGGLVGRGRGKAKLKGKAVKESLEATPEDELVATTTRARLGEDGSVTIKSDSASAEGLAYLNDTAAKRIQAPIGILRNPVVSGLTSKSKAAREWVNNTFNHTFELDKNIRGEATSESIEAAVQLDEVGQAKILSDVDKIYLHHIGVTDNVLSPAAEVKATKLDGKMTRSQFDTEISRAMRNGDEHEIKAVADAAKRYRGEVDKLYKRGVELNLIDESIDARIGKSYFTRKYNSTKILTNGKGFRDAYRADLHKQGISPKKANAEAWATFKQVTRQGDDEAVVNSVLRRLSTGAGSIGKARVANVTDNGIAEFLDDDATNILANYMKSMSHAIRFQEGLERVGAKSVIDVQNKIRKDFDELIGTLNKEEDVVKLIKEKEQAVKDAGDSAAIMLGQFTNKGEADKALRNLRKFQVLTSLGGVVISSLAEPAMHIMRNGLPSFIQEASAKVLKAIDGSNMEAKAINDLILGLETESNEVIKNLLDPNYGLGVSKSKVDKAFDVASSGFGKLSGIKYWTDFNRRLAGTHASGMIIRNLKKIQSGQALEPKEVTRLASLGIGKEDYNSINKMINEYSTSVNGSYVSHFADWPDEAAKRKFMLAIQKEVDATVLLRGKGSTPFAAQRTELTKTFFQFKTFMSLATDKILLAGAQGAIGKRRGEVLQGMVALTTMGMAVEALKNKIAGRSNENIDPEGDDWNDWLIAGMSRSGMLGMLDIPIVGLNPYFNNSRYAGQNAVGTAFGPAVGTIGRAMSITSGMADGEISQQDKDAVIKMLPYNNLFYLKLLLRDYQ